LNPNVGQSVDLAVRLHDMVLSTVASFLAAVVRLVASTGRRRYVRANAVGLRRDVVARWPPGRTTGPVARPAPKDADNAFAIPARRPPVLPRLQGAHYCVRRARARHGGVLARYDAHGGRRRRRRGRGPGRDSGGVSRRTDSGVARTPVNDVGGLAMGGGAGRGLSGLRVMLTVREPPHTSDALIRT
jgi:hypothetical protein